MVRTVNLNDPMPFIFILEYVSGDTTLVIKKDDQHILTLLPSQIKDLRNQLEETPCDRCKRELLGRLYPQLV